MDDCSLEDDMRLPKDDYWLVDDRCLLEDDKLP